jgi:hypothetical protein
VRVNGIVVICYADDAQGTMVEGGDGGGEFTAVTLRPRAAIAASGQANRAPGTGPSVVNPGFHHPRTY